MRHRLVLRVGPRLRGPEHALRPRLLVLTQPVAAAELTGLSLALFGGVALAFAATAGHALRGVGLGGRVCGPWLQRRTQL